MAISIVACIFIMEEEGEIGDRTNLEFRFSTQPKLVLIFSLMLFSILNHNLKLILTTFLPYKYGKTSIIPTSAIGVKTNCSS